MDGDLETKLMEICEDMEPEYLRLVIRFAEFLSKELARE